MCILYNKKSIIVYRRVNNVVSSSLIEFLKFLCFVLLSITGEIIHAMCSGRIQKKLCGKNKLRFFETVSTCAMSHAETDPSASFVLIFNCTKQEKPTSR